MLGYSGTGTVGTCVNIDECSNSKASCPANSDCIDTMGSYICSCKDGYRSNGDLCEEINECDLGHQCEQVGSFKVKHLILLLCLHSWLEETADNLATARLAQVTK